MRDTQRPALPTPLGPDDFPARARLRSILPGEASSPPLAEDAVLLALRRLRERETCRPPAEGGPARSAEADRHLVAELERQNARLRRLLTLPLPEATRPTAPAADPPPLGQPEVTDTRLAEALLLLERAAAFHAEWRQLLLEDNPPEAVLREFAASPYLDLLERHHTLPWLLLDREGCLLRAGRPDALPRPLETGAWLQPGPLREGRLLLGRAGWEDSGAWLGVELAGALFLVQPAG